MKHMDSVLAGDKRKAGFSLQESWFHRRPIFCDNFPSILAMHYHVLSSSREVVSDRLKPFKWAFCKRTCPISPLQVKTKGYSTVFERFFTSKLWLWLRDNRGTLICPHVIGTLTFPHRLTSSKWCPYYPANGFHPILHVILCACHKKIRLMISCHPLSVSSCKRR